MWSNSPSIRSCLIFFFRSLARSKSSASTAALLAVSSPSKRASKAPAAVMGWPAAASLTPGTSFPGLACADFSACFCTSACPAACCSTFNATVGGLTAAMLLFTATAVASAINSRAPAERLPSSANICPTCAGICAFTSVLFSFASTSVADWFPTEDVPGASLAFSSGSDDFTTDSFGAITSVSTLLRPDLFTGFCGVCASFSAIPTLTSAGGSNAFNDCSA
mmetsp:Transcript_61550/g.198171  ORF Transcript_61550/g.198171 Transcript_61550/m.198171 type:complete len:222 (-) Transcript_61550:163-828(-)